MTYSGAKREVVELGRTGAVPMGVPPGQGMGILDYFAIVWKFRLTFFLCLLVAIALSVFITFKTAVSYRAELRLEVQDLNQNFMNVGDLNPGASSNPAAPDAYVQLQAQVLQSDALLDRVIKRLHLDERTDYIAQSVSSAQKWAQKLRVDRLLSLFPNTKYSILVRKAFSLPLAGLDSAHTRALEVAKSNLKVKAASQSEVIEIYYAAPDGKLPAEFLNTLAEEYIAYTMETRWAGTERTAVWLNTRLKDMRDNLEKSEKKLQDYARNSGMVSSNDKESVDEARLRQLQSDWSKAEAGLTEAQAKYERASASSAAQLPEVLEDPVLRDYSTRLADIEKQYSQLSVTMKPAHQQVRSVQAEINTLKALVQAQTANVLGRMKNEFEAAKRREALLKAAYKGQYQLVSNEAAAAVPFHMLQSDVESKRQFYQDMLQKVNSAGVATAIRSSNIQVVDQAKEQILPYRPDPLMNLLVGTASGLLLGVGACFLCEANERRSKKLRHPGDAARYLQLREFGAIPPIQNLDAPRKRWLARKSLAGLQIGERTPALLSQPAEWMRNTPTLNESFQAALDSLIFPLGEQPSPKVIGVVSALPQEGKTTIAACLGLGLADLGKRVLLVDADMRRPSLAKYFRAKETAGLTGLLAHEVVTAELLKSAISRTAQEQIDLLPAGASADNIVKLLATPRFEEILEKLRESYDLVLIDTAPVLLFPETRAIGRQADGVVMVVRSNKNSVDVYRHAAEVLCSSGNQILGTILNDCERSLPASAYRSYEGYVSS